MLMPNRFNAKVPPAWNAILIDESEFYEDEFLTRCGGKLYGVYLADLNSRTYCCELTPSNALYFIGSVPEEWPEDDEEKDSLYDDLSESDTCSPEVSYFHCHSIKAMPDSRKHAIQLDEDDWGDAENDGYEAALEAYQACPEFG